MEERRPMDPTRRLLRVFGVMATLTAVVALAVLAAAAVGPRLGLYRTETVLSGSMRPAFSPGDVIVVRSPLEEEYRRLCAIGRGASNRGTTLGQPRMSVDVLRLGSARRAVLLRSEGHCENPRCTGEAKDITDAGHPILEVDHIQDLAEGGLDHPEQMIALCPNCHAIKTRGRTREQLGQELFTVARQRHEAILSR